jgi:hypothetical protein
MNIHHIQLSSQGMYGPCKIQQSSGAAHQTVPPIDNVKYDVPETQPLSSTCRNQPHKLSPHYLLKCLTLSNWQVSTPE